MLLSARSPPTIHQPNPFNMPMNTCSLTSFDLQFGAIEQPPASAPAFAQVQSVPPKCPHLQLDILRHALSLQLMLCHHALAGQLILVLLHARGNLQVQTARSRWRDAREDAELQQRMVHRASSMHKVRHHCITASTKRLDQGVRTCCSLPGLLPLPGTHKLKRLTHPYHVPATLLPP